MGREYHTMKKFRWRIRCRIAVSNPAVVTVQLKHSIALTTISRIEVFAAESTWAEYTYVSTIETASCRLRDFTVVSCLVV